MRLITSSPTKSSGGGAEFSSTGGMERNTVNNMSICFKSFAVMAMICFCFIESFAQPAAPEPIDILTMTNLQQCQLAIKGLKKLGGFNDKYHQIWEVDRPLDTKGMPIVLNLNTNVQYSVVAVSVDCRDAKSPGHVSSLSTKTLKMTIKETEKLGLQLCAAMKIDSDNFKKWCVQARSQGIDSGRFSSRCYFYDEGKRYVKFEALHSFNNAKPWKIMITIGDNPSLNIN